MRTGTASRFDPAALRQLAAALKIRRTGAYAFVGYAHDSVHWDRLNIRGFSVAKLSSQSGVTQYRTVNAIATRQHGKKRHPPLREVHGRFFASKLITPGAFLFLTPERDEYVRDGLVRLLYRSRKYVMRARLTSAEMLSIVSGLAQASKTKLITSRSLLRSKRNEATISYKAESLRTLYDYARDSQANVDGFDFTLITSAGDTLIRAGLNRSGKLSYHSGSEEFFINGFVESVAQTVKARTDLLRNRARSNETGEVRPLRLKFDEPLFGEAGNVRTLLTVLGKIRHGEFTLFHRNPYLHLSFFDFFDASEFDVVIDAVDSLVVVPQFDSSLPSLFRLCQKIFEQFEEGIISDADDVVRAPAHEND
jgi:hypothetical protein